LRGNEIPKLGKDVFRKLVIEQKLRGKSLLALCTSDRDIASLCDRDDQVLFKTLLKEEFNFDYNKHYAKGSPRELYAKLHKFRVEIYITVTGVQDNEAEIKSAYKLIRDDEIGPEAINRYLKDYRQRVVVPLEGWFAENFNRRPARPFDMALLPGSNEQVQSPVYLVYVSNMPETASLVRRKATVYDSNEYTSGAYETSNSWFSNYFSQNNRLPLHNEEIFRNPIRSVEALIKLMLSRNPIRLAIDVTTENGENLTIACILLSGGGLR
jgi:hypothetical protein